MRFAEVAVDAPTGRGRTFSYAIPDGMDARPGHLVQAPFGARALPGIVFALSDAPQVSETKDIAAILCEDTLLDDTRLRLAEWISEYYMCSLFEAAAPMLPPGGRVRPKTSLALTDADTDTDALTPLQKRVVEYIAKRESAGRVAAQERLVKALGDSAEASVASLVAKGIVKRDYSISKPSMRHKRSTSVSLCADKAADIEEWLNNSKQRAPKRRALLERLRQDGGAMDAAAARKEYGSGAVRALLDKGWLATQTTTVDRDPLDGRVFARVEALRLTDR